MQVRPETIGLTLLILSLVSCSQCETWLGSCGSGVIMSAPAADCPGCAPPRWYFSGGRYLSRMDDRVTREAAIRCAHETLDRRPYDCPRSRDFCDGYTQAFIDMAFGSCGVIPAVPPERYWKAHNRSPQGYARVEQWFAGYREGVSDAQAQGHLQYLYIPTSGESLVPGQNGGAFWGPAD